MIDLVLASLRPALGPVLRRPILFGGVASCLLLAATFGCGGDGGVTGTQSVAVFVSHGTISNIFVGPSDILGTTIQGDGNPYRGGAYLIGSCTAVDDGNNVTTRGFELPTLLPVGGATTWTGTLTTINGSNSCAGPDFTWVLSRPDEHTLRSTVDVYNVRQTLQSLSLPSDFFKDPVNRFAYGRPGFRKTVADCNTAPVASDGLPFQELAPTCGNGAGIFVGFAIQGPPLGVAEWRNDRLRVGLRRTILGGNYQHVTMFSAPGADNLQPSWDSGPIHPGATLHADEEWTIFNY